MTFCANDGEVLQNDTNSLVGQKIDNQYYIEALLGKGGMGSVYKARHVLLGDLVALKVLSPDMRDNEEWLKRFQREGQAARMFRHPNAVTVHDLRTTPDGLMYLVMEYIEGRTLSDELAARGRYTPADAYALLEPIMSVLHAAHMTGVVHRDLKPDNVMLGQAPNGMPFIKLLDLGVAKVLPRANADEAEHISQAKLTTAGQLLGTPFYMSPEQWGELQRDGNEEIDARSDLYSLGAVVYEMVAGHKPFYGGSLYELCDSHLHRTPTPLAELRPDVAPAFSQSVARALSKDRNDRQPNVQVFADDLHDALTQSPVASTNYGYDAPSPAATDYGYNNAPASPQTIFDPSAGRATFVDQAGGGTPYDHSPQTNVGGFNAAQTIVEGGAGSGAGADTHATIIEYGARPTITPQPPVITPTPPVTTGHPLARADLPPTVAPPVVATANQPALLAPEPHVVTAPTPGGGSGFPAKLLAIPALLLLLAIGGGAWYFLASKSATNSNANKSLAAADTMRYWLEVTTPVPKGQPEAAPRRVAGGPFVSGQDFKLHFAAPANGYLYIVGPGENNAPTTFLTAQPIPETGVTSNRLNAGTTFTFPGGSRNWLSLDKKAGTEVFTIVFSPTPLTNPAFLADNAGEVLNLAEWDDFRTKYMANKATLNVSSENGAPFVGIQAPQKDAPILVEIRLEHQ